jgi:glycosyltransferase involved in cell wall biosynthesis
MKNVLYMDDLFSIRYARLLAAQRDFKSINIDALGNFSKNLPAALIKIYKISGLLRSLLLRAELRLVSKAENRCVVRFDSCLLVSAVEAQILRSRTGAGNIHAIPPRIDQPASAKERSWHGNADFVFLGSLNLPHNAFGIEYFIQSELARIAERIPNARILVVGKGASGNLQRLAQQHAPFVHLMGFVNDLDEVLSNSCAMLSPLLFGSGIKIKALDALRCGIPLITTSIGIEGIDVASVAGVKVEDSLKGFLEIMLELLDLRANRNAGIANRQAFHDRYVRSVVDQTYSRLFFDKGAQVNMKRSVGSTSTGG